MANIVYILCALTSLTCAVLLWRGYLQRRSRLLFWSGWCFVGLALNNLLLIMDLRVFPEVDLSVVRGLPALAGLGLLIFGLIWEKH